jgi:hypothetical protein
MTPPRDGVGMGDGGPKVNTDREIWRETPGDFYAPSIHVTEGGGIRIDVGGMVRVKPVREWHRLGGESFTPDAPGDVQGDFPGLSTKTKIPRARMEWQLHICPHLSEGWCRECVQSNIEAWSLRIETDLWNGLNSVLSESVKDHSKSTDAEGRK